ncbi:MAG TPA: aminotransferase class V-fold PLP-dependent enzyme, partial [Oscillospiraceae bacterium]|nr:aminotransferase class V-fold PLP-dependent enzyme [Oscillospiraceae bacterium]
MINFDNAATTFPKPESVKNAVLTAFSKYGGNPGRSGHKLSMQTAMAIYNARN